jgi:ribosome biogenesis SPOUT family RNA methylase Rps3
MPWSQCRGPSLTLLPVALDKVPYVDFPELKFSKHESTEMPFRYVTDDKGEPILPAVSHPPKSQWPTR